MIKNNKKEWIKIILKNLNLKKFKKKLKIIKKNELTIRFKEKN